MLNDDDVVNRTVFLTTLALGSVGAGLFFLKQFVGNRAALLNCEKKATTINDESHEDEISVRSMTPTPVNLNENNKITDANVEYGSDSNTDNDEVVTSYTEDEVLVYDGENDSENDEDSVVDDDWSYGDDRRAQKNRTSRKNTIS